LGIFGKIFEFLGIEKRLKIAKLCGKIGHMKKLVITGSSGFIGMNFIEHNLKLSHKKEKSIFDEFEVIELVDEDQLKNEKGHVWMLDYNAGFFREMFDMKEFLS